MKSTSGQVGHCTVDCHIFWIAYHESMSAQAALWLVWKSAKGDRNKLALPLSVFGLHLFLGNWWNGVPLIAS